MGEMVISERMTSSATDGGSRFFVNGRFQDKNQTGTQRYARELTSRFGDACNVVSPRVSMDGIAGHIWEQAILPLRARKSLLWSPCNTGPLIHRRQVVTVHDMAFIDVPECFSRQFVRWYSWLVPRLVRRALRVITDSEYSRRRISEIVDIELSRIDVIPIGISEKFTPAASRDIGRIRHRYGLDGEYVLAVGSLEPRKNLRGLLEAWRAVSERRPKLTLALAGAGGISCFGAVGVEPSSFSNVRTLGFVEDADLPSLYAGCVAFVFPSLYEGFGMPPLEAMACGAPVVSSNTTSLPEVIGDAALLVDPLESESIAQAILLVADDPELRDSLRRRGFEQSRKFNWDTTAVQTLRVLREAVAMD